MVLITITYTMNYDNENDNNELFNYTFINERRVRGSVNDCKELWVYKHCKTKPHYWWKLKVSIRKHPSGYKNYKVCISHQQYSLARVIYKLYNNTWDITDSSNTNQVIHINNNSLDVSIENLRNLTQQHNMWIRKCVSGVYETETGKWRGRISLNGIQTTKQFESKEEAKEWYQTMKDKYHVLPA